jgi:hypothetical protein
MRIQIKNLPTISTPEPEKQNHMEWSWPAFEAMRLEEAMRKAECLQGTLNSLRNDKLPQYTHRNKGLRKE